MQYFNDLEDVMMTMEVVEEDIASRIGFFIVTKVELEVLGCIEGVQFNRK